jgi:hypothetical protein
MAVGENRSAECEDGHGCRSRLPHLDTSSGCGDRAASGLEAPRLRGASRHRPRAPRNAQTPCTKFGDVWRMNCTFHHMPQPHTRNKTRKRTTRSRRAKGRDMSAGAAKVTNKLVKRARRRESNAFVPESPQEEMQRRLTSPRPVDPEHSATMAGRIRRASRKAEGRPQSAFEERILESAQGRSNEGGEDFAIAISPTGTQQRSPQSGRPRIARSRAKPGRRRQRKAHAV